MQELCVGKSECTIDASDSAFSADPCVGTTKRLAVAVTGCNSALTFHQSATVPVGSTASITVPTVGTASPSVALVSRGGCLCCCRRG